MKPGSRFMSWRGSFGSGTTEGPHRSAIPEKQPQEYPVTIEIEGKRYTGFYTVSSGVVTVESDWGKRISPAGPTAARTARLLFREILLTVMDRSKRS
jgi:hypothetical protein